MNTLGERIAFLRKKNSLSQSDLMRVLRFNNLGKYELNERKPSLDLIIAISRYFGVSTDWLLLGCDVREDDPPAPIELLAYGKPETRSDYDFTAEDLHLLSMYRKLSDRHQAKAEGYIEGLLSAQPPLS